MFSLIGSGYTGVTDRELKPLLSGFAYSIFCNWNDYVAWKHKETGLYALSLGYLNTREILGQGMTLDQLESKLCHECPFYSESGEEGENEPCSMEACTGY